MAQPEYSPDEHCNGLAWFSNNWFLKTSGLETWLGEKPQEPGRWKNPQRHVVLRFEVLAEEQLLIISQQVVERDLMNSFDDNNYNLKVTTNLAIDCGSDDARSVGSFKVSAHDLVKLSIAQTLENMDLSNEWFWIRNSPCTSASNILS